MRLYSDIIDRAALHAAAFTVRHELHQDIYIEDCESTHGRRRKHSLNFHCASFSGSRRQNRNGSREPAASWAAWGWLIAELFRRDPNAHIGQYKGVSDFRRRCQSAHDHRVKYERRFGENKRSDYGKDISFLSLIKGRRTNPKATF